MASIKDELGDALLDENGESIWDEEGPDWTDGWAIATSGVVTVDITSAIITQ